MREDGGPHGHLRAIRLLDSLPRFLFPTRRRGSRRLREQLRGLGVKVPLSPGCVDEYVMDADAAAAASRSSNETYAASLYKQLEARAKFIHLWTSSDDKIAREDWSQWIAIARRHLLPRSWTITETTVTELHRDQSFAVPEQLVVKGSQSSKPLPPIDSADQLPGVAILSDLKRANDKS